MWTDFWGDSRSQIELKIAALKEARVSGQAVEIIIAGVKTRMAESSSDPQLSISTRLSDAQEYLWRIIPTEEGGGGMDYSLPLRPRAYRNRQTTVVSC